MTDHLIPLVLLQAYRDGNTSEHLLDVHDRCRYRRSVSCLWASPYAGCPWLCWMEMAVLDRGKLVN